jgi:tripartite-type tricarboxylate transporter receptor subunit TctC
MLSMLRTTKRCILNCALVLLTSLVGIASAQTSWPTRPVKIVVPFPSGTSPDIVARLLSQKLSERLGQQFVVENRAGAGGILGTELVAKSAPDGHTVLMTVNSIMAMNPFIYKKLPYDPVKDFQSVSTVSAVSYVLIANKNFKHKTLVDLFSAAKANPKSINYASMGQGGAGHVVVELMSSQANIELMHIPYKAGALVDVISGQVPLILQPTTTALEQIKNGNVFGLGVTHPKRIASLPDVPAIAEFLPGFNGDGWQGLVMPAATPMPIVEQLQKEVSIILAMPDVMAKFASLGIEPWPSTPKQMETIIAQELDKWGSVIRRAKIEPM